MAFQAYLTSTTNYTEAPTGLIEDQTFEEWVSKNQMEIVSRDGSTVKLEAEWGNGEGVDTYEVELLDTTGSTGTAFHADFNSFSEIVTSNGIVIRRIEQPGGGATFTVVAENVNADDFMTNEGAEGEWYEADEETVRHWMEMAGIA